MVVHLLDNSNHRYTLSLAHGMLHYCWRRVDLLFWSVGKPRYEYSYLRYLLTVPYLLEVRIRTYSARLAPATLSLRRSLSWRTQRLKKPSHLPT